MDAPKQEKRDAASHNSQSGYTDDEFEFLKAVEKWRRENRIQFPTWVQILNVAKSLGYRKPEHVTESDCIVQDAEQTPNTQAAKEPSLFD